MDLRAHSLDLPGGRVLLRENTKADTLDLVLVRDGAETTVRTLTPGQDHVRAGDLSLRPFSGLLGSSGFLLRNTWGGSGGWGVSTYYALEPAGAVQIAETFGVGGDHAVDLDGDGVKELVCSCVYGGDGRQTVLVFQRRANGVRFGGIDPAGLPGLDGRDVGSTAAWFDPERKVFVVRYTVRGRETPGSVTFSGLEHLRFAPHRPGA